MQDQYLFVYGSLRRNGSHHYLLASDCRYIGAATLAGDLYQVSSYPGVVKSQRSNNPVMGELYLLSNPDAVLDRLDDYEGCSANFAEPFEFVREAALVTVETGAALQAWVYFYNLPIAGFQRIESGNFR